jgi:hypothetical protein
MPRNEERTVECSHIAVERDVRPMRLEDAPWKGRDLRVPRTFPPRALEAERAGADAGKDLRESSRRASGCRRRRLEHGPTGVPTRASWTRPMGPRRAAISRTQ